MVPSSHLTPQLDSKEPSMALRHLAGSLALAAALHIALPMQVAASLQAEVPQSIVTLPSVSFKQSRERGLHASSEPEAAAMRRARTIFCMFTNLFCGEGSPC